MIKVSNLKPISSMTNGTKKSGSIITGKSSKNPFKKKTQKKLDKMNEFMTTMFDELQKRLNENKIEISKVQEFIGNIEKDKELKDKIIDEHAKSLDKTKE